MKLGSLPDRLVRSTRLKPRLVGHVDRVEYDTLHGWAADLAHLDRRVIVECWHAGRVVASAVAGDPRDDLGRAGIGDGDHGFTCTLPDSCATIPDLRVRVAIQGSAACLPYEGRDEIAVEMREVLWFVAADIVNNCNLRCPFCLVDYSGITKTELMTEETYRSLLRLIHSVPDGQFYLSCLHEPTLHPRLNQFLGLIPPEARRKVFFTTNLARPLKAADFEAWARSGIHHVNVSLDTMDAERFAVLRKFGRLDVFMRNLELMTDVFRETPGAPAIRYITMAFKSNIEELPAIVRRSRERWLASENEIRYTFNAEHITDDFRRREYLDKAHWEALTERLHETGYPVTISYPPEEESVEETVPSQNYDEPRAPGGARALHLLRPMGLRARPDGTLLVVGAEDGLRVNIRALEDPVRFFRGLLKQSRPREGPPPAV